MTNSPPAHATLHIQGMTCQHCVQTVTRALTSVPGISEAHVDLAQNSARITYDPAVATLPKVMQAVNATGFRAAGFAKD
jgi:copper chaperone